MKIKLSCFAGTKTIKKVLFLLGNLVLGNSREAKQPLRETFVIYWKYNMIECNPSF